jgi:hypothetical protein
VVRERGDRIGVGTALWRSFLVYLAPFVWLATSTRWHWARHLLWDFDEADWRNRFLHDHLADTKVVRTR